MKHLRGVRSLGLSVAMCCLALTVSGEAHGQVAEFGQAVVDEFMDWTGLDSAGTSSLSVRQLAHLIDDLDKKLYKYGKVAVKSPDVFGQNRMTGYRADYEDQMKGQLGAFELILSSYLRRSDSAALTSATSVQAGIQPSGAIGRRATPRATSSSNSVAIPAAPVPFSSLFTNASQLVGTASADLTPTTAAALSLSNTGAKAGIGLEPTVALDERSNYIYHLNQLRRINAGDDSADVPGYGLYLIRMPVSLLPSGESVMGKGASVTVKAKHSLTSDVLPNTFRNVVLLDTAYSLTDALNRGQFLESLLDDPAATTEPAPGLRIEIASVPNLAGNTHGASGNAPSTEVLQLFGGDNLKILVNAMKAAEVTWYRHDPSTISWLLSELDSAYGYMRDQAHRNNPLFQPIVFEQVGAMALQRRYTSLEKYRKGWIRNLRIARGYDPTAKDKKGNLIVEAAEPIDVLSFALIVQSVFLDRQIKHDMEFLAQRKGCACGDPWALSFYDLYPSTPEDVDRYSRAQGAFAAYVECKWPIHVFAIDPVVDQQNQLDLFSQRTQLQLALAIAISSGSVNFQNATSYARRTELDLETVALNRTAIGFGAGETTFGWQFYPRIQTPPLQSNPQRIFGILANNGPRRNYELEHRKIEPGLRECYALVVMPNFVPSVRLTSVVNWFDLKDRCPEQLIETTDMVRLSKKFQTAKNSVDLVCDSGRYRHDEVEMLADRLSQLEDMLPLKTHKIDLPFEGSLLGSEIFSSNAAGLAPRLLAWYGEPPQEGQPSSIFLLGNGFTVYETHAIAGGVAVSEDTSQGKKLELISRNVMRIEIPANARTSQVHKSDAQGIKRKLIDVHVATPNGISNHLLVEVQPKDDSKSTASPTQNAATKSLTISYVLLRKADTNANANAPGFVPVFLGVAPANAEVDLTWPAAGAVPATVDASINFPIPGGAPDLTITSKGLTHQPVGGGVSPGGRSAQHFRSGPSRSSLQTGLAQSSKAGDSATLQQNHSHASGGSGDCTRLECVRADCHQFHVGAACCPRHTRGTFRQTCRPDRAGSDKAV